MSKSTKHVAITGAGSGLGAALARKYSERGHQVTLIGRTKEKLENVAKTLEGDHHKTYTLDVSSYQDVVSVFEDIKTEVGVIDILVNNAGLGFFKLAEDLTHEEIDLMIDVNLKGTIYCTQQVLTDMKKLNAGSIINIVSTAGIEGKVTESAYCASKFGVRGFTESLARELEESDIHVHSIYMGGMKTPFWDGIIEDEDTGGLMDPEDIADIVLANTEYRKNINVPEVVIKNH